MGFSKISTAKNYHFQDIKLHGYDRFPLGRTCCGHAEYDCIAHIPFSTSFFGLPSVPLAGLALGVVCGFSDKSLIDGKLSRVASLSDILTFVLFLFIELYSVLFRFAFESFVVRVSKCTMCWCFCRIHLKYKDDKYYLLFWLYNQLFFTQTNKQTLVLDWHMRAMEVYVLYVCIRCVQCAYLQLIQSGLIAIKSVEMSLFYTISALVCVCWMDTKSSPSFIHTIWFNWINTSGTRLLRNVLDSRCCLVFTWMPRLASSHFSLRQSTIGYAQNTAEDRNSSKQLISRSVLQ